MQTNPSESRSEYSAHALVITWALLIPMLFFLVKGAFSLDHTQYNNALIRGVGSTIRYGQDSLIFGLEGLIVHCAVLMLIALRQKAIYRTLAQNKMLLILPAWALVSTIWSQSPSKSFINGSYIIILTMFGAFLTNRFSAKQLIDLFALMGAFAIGLSISAVCFVPEAGIDANGGQGAWQGIFVSKNNCGEAMSYLCICAFCLDRSTLLRKIAVAGYTCLAIMFVIMSQSRTAWLLCAAMLLGFCVIRTLGRLGSREKVLAIAGIAASMACIGAIGIAYASQIAMLLGKDATMTGRTDIWAAILSILWKRPFLGFGYSAFWLGLKGESANLILSSGLTTLANAENAVLQIWLELGGIGVVLLAITLLMSCKNAAICLKHRPPQRVQWAIMIVFITMLALVDGDKIMAPHTIEWLFFVVAYLVLSDRARQIKSHTDETARFQIVGKRLHAGSVMVASSLED